MSKAIDRIIQEAKRLKDEGAEHPNIIPGIGWQKQCGCKGTSTAFVCDECGRPWTEIELPFPAFKRPVIEP